METSATGAAQTNRLPLVALLSANAISLVGNQLTYIAIPWFVLQTTGSAVRTGIAAFFSTVPAILAAFFGGTPVDRLGYKRISVTADLASGATLALVPALYHTVGLAFWQLLVLTFLGALLDAPGGTARDSLVPDLAERAGVRLERVNAMSQTLWRTSGLLGPPLAGVLIAALGTSAVLFLDAASFAVSAGLVAGAVPSSSRPARAPQPVRSYFAELHDGLRFIRHDQLLLAVVLSFTLLNALGEPVFGVVLPVYASRTFDSAVDLGLMLAAFAGGGLIGAALFGLVGHRLPRRATYIASLTLSSVLFWVLVVAPPLAIILGALAFAGVVGAPLNLIATTVAQERIPAGMRGRVFGMIRALALSALPLGMLLVGYLLEVIGIRPTLTAVALGYLLLASLLLANRALREMDSAQ